MTRQEKQDNNKKVIEMWENAQTEVLTISSKNAQRLRTCNAIVFETENYYFLASYSTIVAFIEKSTDTLVDVLRYVYGYTSTSAQHISKFNKDYSQGLWGALNSYRYLV